MTTSPGVPRRIRQSRLRLVREWEAVLRRRRRLAPPFAARGVPVFRVSSGGTRQEFRFDLVARSSCNPLAQCVPVTWKASVEIWAELLEHIEDAVGETAGADSPLLLLATSPTLRCELERALRRDFERTGEELELSDEVRWVRLMDSVPVGIWTELKSFRPTAALLRQREPNFHRIATPSSDRNLRLRASDPSLPAGLLEDDLDGATTVELHGRFWLFRRGMPHQTQPNRFIGGRPAIVLSWDERLEIWAMGPAGRQ